MEKGEEKEKEKDIGEENFENPSAREGIQLQKMGGEKTTRLGMSRKFQNQRFENW